MVERQLKGINLICWNAKAINQTIKCTNILLHLANLKAGTRHLLAQDTDKLKLNWVGQFFLNHIIKTGVEVWQH